MELPPPNALRAFEVVGRHESFRDAAHEMNVSVGSVSRYMQLLEENLGLQLFERHPRGVTLSPAGRVYHETVTSAFDNLRNVTDRLRRQTASFRRHLVWSLPALGACWLAPRMERIRPLLGESELHLALNVANTDIMYNNVDFAVVPDYFAPRGSDRFRIVNLYLESFMPVCSPRRLHAEPPLARPQDIFNHPLLVYRHVIMQWNDWTTAAGIPTIEPNRCVNVDNGLAAYHAAQSNYGIALGERMKVADQLRRGELVTPFDTVADSGHYVCLCWRQHPALDKIAERLVPLMHEEVQKTLGDGVDPNSTDWPAFRRAGLGKCSSPYVPSATHSG